MRLTTHFLLSLLLLVTACIPVRAADFAPLGKNPNFSRLMMDSVPNVGEVQAFRQDNHGFMWIGGKTGLARYDGYRFQLFVNSSKDEHSLSANSIFDIFEDSQGRLWVGTEGGGAVRYNRDKENFDRVEYAHDASINAKTTQVIYRIFEDSHKDLWFAGNYGVGLYDAAHDQIVPQLANSWLNKYRVTDIAETSDGNYFIASTGGGYYWNRHENRGLQLVSKEGDPNALPTSVLRCVTVDSYHNIWVAHDKGISRFRPETGDFENFIIPNSNPKISGTPVWSVFEDNKKILWLATDGNGLMYFDPVSKKMSGYSSTASYASLSKSVTRRVYQDRAGDYWIGMFPIGVSYFDSSNNFFSLYNNFVKNNEGMFRNQVWAFQEDEQGNLWLGIDDLGLVYFDRKKGTFSKIYDGFDFSNVGFPKSVLSLYRDSHDNLWFGAWAEGLGRLNLKTKQFDLFKKPKNGNPRTVFPALHVWTFFEAHNGDIYIGTTSNGFVTYSYATDEFINHPRNPNLPDDQTLDADAVWSMYEDKSGKIWMATGSGIAIYNPATNRYKKYNRDPNDPNGLSHYWITSFLLDSKGRFWVSTMGGGLDLFHPETETFTHYRAEDGLGSDAVQGTIEDKNGTIWVSTRAGLTAFDPDKKVFTRYSDKNWLQKGEFNTGAFARLHTGELVFGGVNGFNLFNPSDVTVNNYVPPIYFTELELFDKPITASTPDSPLKKSIIDTDSITLHYNQDVFSLAFTALNYRVHGDNQYRYILEGFDRDWHSPTTSNRVTYTHLDAGTYTFRVQASNNTGLWNPREKTLTIIVTPAPWRTWWAYSIYALLIVSFISWYVQHQRSQIRQAAILNAKLVELDKLKDNFMANTSHELRTPVNGILGMAHALRDGDASEQLPAAAKEKLNVILSCGRRLARLVNDILDFSAISESQLLLNRGCVNLAALLPQVIEECHIQHTNIAIKVENQLNSDLPLVFVDEARTLNVFYNIIANAFKFTEQGFVRITSAVTESHVSIKVADSGVGIDKENIARIFSSFSQVANSGVNQKNGTGLGLAISKYLVELHGGTLTVESTKDVGSVFTVSLPRATEQQLAELNAARAASQDPAAISKQPLAKDIVDVKLAVFYPKTHAGNPGQSYPRIMVVDDEPVNRMVLRHMLLKRNYVVYEAANGQEAVDAIEQGFTCDLILLDIMMPKLSGLEACKQIRILHSAAQLPIIFVTAKTQQQDRDECMAVGGNDFITKPVANDALYAHMDALMVRHQ